MPERLKRWRVAKPMRPLVYLQNRLAVNAEAREGQEGIEQARHTGHCGVVYRLIDFDDGSAWLWYPACWLRRVMEAQ
jgi:hypothetical protein